MHDVKVSGEPFGEERRAALQAEVHMLTPQQVGCEYWRPLQHHVSVSSDTQPFSGGVEEWILDAVFAGDGLADDVYLDVILAAVEQTGGAQDLLWCLGDGPVDPPEVGTGGGAWSSIVSAIGRVSTPRAA